MRSSAATPAPFSWTRTRDGVVVLRFHPDWPVEGDAERMLPSGRIVGDIPVLFDLREARDDEAAHTLARFVAAIPSFTRRVPQRRAYVARRGQQRIMARMLQFDAEPLRFEAAVFTEWDDALDWLRGARWPSESGSAGVPEVATIQ